MVEREFDPGLDTPKANEPGAGWPVPGSPVWEDARLRERVSEAQRRVDEQSAENPDDPEPRLNEVETVQAAAQDKTDAEDKTDAKTTAVAKRAEAKAAADKAAADKAAADKTAKGQK